MQERRAHPQAEEGTMRQVEGRSLSFSAHLQSHRCLPAPQGCAPGRLGAGRTLSLLEPLHRGDPGPAHHESYL